MSIYRYGPDEDSSEVGIGSSILRLLSFAYRKIRSGHGSLVYDQSLIWLKPFMLAMVGVAPSRYVFALSTLLMVPVMPSNLSEKIATHDHDSKILLYTKRCSEWTD